MASSEAIRRWQAESLAKRLLEEDDLPAILASAFDLRCQTEFEEAISTLAVSKERAIGRTSAEGFADFSVQVDSALENTHRIEKAKQVLTSTDSLMRQQLIVREKLKMQLEVTENDYAEIKKQREEVEMCIQWRHRRGEFDNLLKTRQYLFAQQLQRKLSEEWRHYPNSKFATSLRMDINKVNILRICEQELDVWMTEALEKGREFGFALFAGDIDTTSLVSKTGLVDVEPVRRFFAIARRDYAEERYANHRLPALRQTVSSLSRAMAAGNMEERVVRFRNALAEICGFFQMEKVVGALHHGELKESWIECCSKLVQALETGFPSADSEAENAEILACDFARMCLVVQLDFSPLQRFFSSRLDVVRSGWTKRSFVTISDYCKSEMNKKAVSDDSVLPFTSKTVQELTRAVRDAKLLNQFTSGGFLSTWKDLSPWSILETLVVERSLQSVLQSGSCELSDALFVFRASRELRIHSDSPSAFFETETKARELVHDVFVASKVDRIIVFQNPQDYLPSLTPNTSIEPHSCVLKALQEIEQAFASEEAAAIPREVRASLQQETIGRLADRLDTCIFKDAPMLNPLAIKLFSLDVLALDQAFPDHFERFGPLLNGLLPFCSENGLENAIADSSDGERERILSVLLRFREMDASSRLFAPPSLRRQIIDMRETEAKKHLSLLQASDLL